MFRIILLMIYLVSTYASTAVQAKEYSPEADICKLVSAYANKGGLAGTSELVNMFSYSEEARSRAENSFGLLKEFEYVAGSAFLVVDLDNLYKQYFAVMNLKGKGNLYFLMEFENVDGKLLLLRFTFADRIEDVANDYGGFTQKPEKIDC
ncbi:hypothetical protein [Roseibium sp. Sym1]|uniref:hypothetical protein n=1 Tax=Roseibium sp. Sym1 TaxID=3016006 RepID=UPI0022B3A35B|nr:hypothetical protein [Roseibium sp. Sym1]